MCNGNNNRYNRSALRYMMYNPLLWGNITLRRTGKSVGQWVFFEHPSKPSDVEIQYGVVEPMYGDDYGRQIQYELIRRLDIQGSTRPQDTYRFSNTCVCGICGNPMCVASTNTKGRRKRKSRYIDGKIQYGLYCSHRYRIIERGERCANTLAYQDTLEMEWDKIFAYLLSGKQLSSYLQEPNTDEPNVNTIEREIQKINQQIQTLIYEQSLASESAQPIYRHQIMKLSERLSIIEDALRMESYKQSQSISLQELEVLLVDSFWDLPDVKINQTLKSILGDYRLVVVHDKVVGIKLRTRSYKMYRKTP
ncbi:MAG: hypothetical protein MUE54_02020 [Anaerolineae bacterium]|jgi:hypothetical protein|nr:hypothetical protein [Anaerolineae bacterium]